MCTGDFQEKDANDAGNKMLRPPKGTRCADPCVEEEGRWGTSWCYTEPGGSEARMSQWGANCVVCTGSHDNNNIFKIQQKNKNDCILFDILSSSFIS